MRTCLINDCTGFVGIAPCCMDCPEREQRPDRCPRTENTFCIGAFEDDGKGMVEPLQDGMERGRGC